MHRIHIGSHKEVPYIGLRWGGENWEAKYGKRAGIIRITNEAMKLVPWSRIRWSEQIVLVGYSYVLSRAMHEFLIASHELDDVDEGQEFGTVGIQIHKDGRVEIFGGKGNSVVLRGTLKSCDVSPLIIHGCN